MKPRDLEHIGSDCQVRVGLIAIQHCKGKWPDMRECGEMALVVQFVVDAWFIVF